MAIKLTPATLRRIVLEEKKKIEGSLDKKALKDLHANMEEGDWSDAPPHAQKHEPGDKPMGPGAKMKEMRELREQEEALRGRLRRLQERRLALRKQIINELG
jgi:cell division protein FtsN